MKESNALAIPSYSLLVVTGNLSTLIEPSSENPEDPMNLSAVPWCVKLAS
jgi:hypothetical protein